MANFPDKASAPIAITEHSKQDLGHKHVSTIDFMELQPSWCWEMMPGSKLDVNMETFCRLNPMPVPGFGRCSLRHRGYFVPMRTIFRGFNDFITDSIHVASNGSAGSYGGLISTVPVITNTQLLEAFMLNSAGTTLADLDGDGMVVFTTDGQEDFDRDFNIGWNGFNVAVAFTNRGRQCKKIVESLGYKMIPDQDANIEYSALPLLAVAKIYADWYFPQQYTELADYQYIMSLLNYDVVNGPISLTPTQIRDILKFVSYVQFDSDFLVSAWDTPNQPYPSTHSDFKLVNIDTASKLYDTAQHTDVLPGYVTNNSQNANADDRLGGADAPFISPYTQYGTKDPIATPISEYLLHQLHSLTDYMKRHQLAGSKAFERFLLQYGKALPAEKLNRSVYLGCVTQEVKIGDVYSSSDTDGANLGAFAGKGMSYGGGNFSYETDEFGYFIIMTSLVPDTGYVQGIDRQVLRTHKLDFFNAEFDCNGIQPISSAEVYVPYADYLNFDGEALFQHVFGFLPRYYDYKKANDQLTGNFSLNSINGEYGNSLGPNASAAWHLFRMFDRNIYPTAADVVHGPDFVSGHKDFRQWKRLFYDIPSEDNPCPPDNFTLITNFEIAQYAPCCSLWDSYDFDMSKGPDRTLQVNGVTHN